MRILHTLIHDFILFLQLDRGAAAKTLEAYRTDLLQWATWTEKNAPPHRQLVEIDTENLRAFLRNCLSAGQKPASVARKASALRQLFRFACLEKGLEVNPAEDLESPSGATRLPRVLSREDIEKLLDAAKQGLPYPSQNQAALRTRDFTAILLLYATGLRVSELLGLTLHTIDLELGLVRVRGKGDKERIVPFPPIVRDALTSFIRRERLQLQPTADALFPNHRGSPLSRQAFWGLLKSLAAQAGIATPFSPHTLRHSFATHLLHGGMNLRSLQILLGHSDLSTTQVYAHIAPENLRDAIDRYHPRAEKVDSSSE